MTGTIKSLIPDRGFGFVTASDGIDYFFHRTNLSDPVLFDELQKGDRLVLIEVENTEKGWRANKVVPEASGLAPQPAA